MAVVVEMVFEDATNAEYDAVMTEAGLRGADIDQIPGAIAHFAFEHDGSLHVFDVWESAAQWQAFSTGTIVAAATRIGLALDPDVTISELHNSML